MEMAGGGSVSTLDWMIRNKGPWSEDFIQIIYRLSFSLVD